MRRRITWLTVLVATLAVGLFAVPLVVVAFAWLLGDERAELERAAEVAAITAAAQIGAGHPVTTLAGAGQDPSAQLGLYDGGGRRVLGGGPDLADPVVTAAAGAGEDARPTTGTVGDDLVAAVRVDPGAAASLTVRAATSRWEVYGHMAVVGLGMTGLAMLAPTLAWLLSRRLARRLTDPLEALARAARRLGEGDFTARGPACGVPEIDAVSAALADTAHRLDSTLARERAFSADASHQLRTPLAGLRLGLEAALENPDGDHPAALRAAVAATDRLQVTIEDLLTLARDTHRGETPLELDTLLAEIADAWQGPLAATGRRLRVHRGDDVPATAASPSAVRQILTVLLDNAHIHGGGEVVVTARGTAGALALDVADEGTGIPEPERLFARRAPGSTNHGIGLALARSLAEAEDGRLQLTSPAPPVFTLLLPAAPLDLTASSTWQAGVPTG